METHNTKFLRGFTPTKCEKLSNGKLKVTYEPKGGGKAEEEAMACKLQPLFPGNSTLDLLKKDSEVEVFQQMI
eukprot:1374488-Amorphochlora_amoeboformis.AAC.1